MRRKPQQTKRIISDYFGFMGQGESGKKLEDRLRRNKKEREYIERLRNRKMDQKQKTF